MTHSKVDSGLNIWNVARTADFSNVKPLYFGILKNTFFDDLNEFDALIGSNDEVIWLVDMNDESVFLFETMSFLKIVIFLINKFSLRSMF